MGKLLWVKYMIESNLKYCREELEMTQTELGYIFGVSKGTVANWENGYSVIPLKKLVKFSNYSGFSLDFICGFTRSNKKLQKIEKINKNSIGNNLKELRKSLGLTQQQFSEKCHIPQSTYSHYEIGYKLITTLNLYSICKTYNVSMDYLVGRTNNKKISK